MASHHGRSRAFMVGKTRLLLLITLLITTSLFQLADAGKKKDKNTGTSKSKGGSKAGNRVQYETPTPASKPPTNSEISNRVPVETPAPTPRPTPNAQQSLDEAKQLWQTQGLTNYEFSTRRICFCPRDYTKEMKAAVLGGATKRVTYADGTTVKVRVRVLTIVEQFKIIQQAIDLNAHYVSVKYDQDYGYPLKVSIDYNAMVADEEFAMSNSNLIPITTPTQCGSNVCFTSEYCCNKSCGECALISGGFCTKKFCAPTSESTEEPSSKPSTEPTDNIEQGNCIECSDYVTPWMHKNGKECGSWPNLEAMCKEKNTYWNREKFCRRSCHDIGHPYEGDVCCGSDNGNRAQVEPSTESTDSTEADNCIECTNYVTPWMHKNGKECESWPWVKTMCKEKTTYWKREKFCRRSCHDAGHPYEGDVCCGGDIGNRVPAIDKPTAVPTPSPTGEPSSEPSSEPTSCIRCTNNAAPWMDKKDETCFSWSFTKTRCREKTNSWKTNKYCQLSCHEFGYPYEKDGVKDVCCDYLSDPTPDPTPAPTAKPSAAPSTGPSSQPSTSPSTTPSSTPTYSPSEEPSAIPSLHPSANPAEKPTAMPTTNVEPDDKCVQCTNFPTPWMAVSGKTCDTWYIGHKCTNDVSGYWQREKFCQESCENAGLGYPGFNCCQNTKEPTPSPTKTTATPTYGDVEPDNCSPCTDVSINSRDCASFSFARLAEKCVGKYWIKRGICQYSCFHAGYSYKQCCANVPALPAPTPEPSHDPSDETSDEPTPDPTRSIEPDNECMLCSNVPPPSWIAKDKTCDTWYIGHKCTNDLSGYWQKAKFCQLSCYHRGLGYPEDTCCDKDAPEPTPAPSLAPSDKSVSPDYDSCLALSNECGPHKPCANGKCCSQWGWCGTGDLWCDKVNCCQSNCKPRRVLRGMRQITANNNSMLEV